MTPTTQPTASLDSKSVIREPNKFGAWVRKQRDRLNLTRTEMYLVGGCSAAAITGVIVWLTAIVIYYQTDTLKTAVPEPLFNAGQTLLLSVVFLLAGAVITFIIFDVLIKRVRDMGELRPHINYEEFVRSVPKSKTDIRLMITATDILNDDPALSASNLREPFLKNLEAFLENPKNANANLEILVLDPFSFSALHREEGYLGQGKRHVPHEIKTNLRILYDWLYQSDALDIAELPAYRKTIFSDRVTVKVFDSVIPFVLFDAGSDRSVIFFKRGVPISQTERFRFYPHTALSRFVDGRFNEVRDEKEFTTRDLMAYMLLEVISNNQTYRVPFVKESRKFEEKRRTEGEECFYLLFSDLSASGADLWSKLQNPDSLSIRWKNSEWTITKSRDLRVAARSSNAERIHLQQVRQRIREKYGDSFDRTYIFEVVIRDQEYSTAPVQHMPMELTLEITEPD